MVNTLQNSPEKIPSKWGNKFKKAIALAIALTLSGEPAEAKTYEKQEFSTEMVSNIPWEYAPMTEAVEQATIPNYINQAQNWVKKYYPQHEEYFRKIINELKWMWEITKNTFNKKIQENFETFEEEITTEKDKCTTILIIIDNLLWNKDFIRSNITVDSPEWRDMIEGIANEISTDISIQLSKELKKVKEKHDKIKKIKNEIYNNNNNNPEWILNSIEKLFEITNLKEVKNDKSIQEIIKCYISIWKKINWNPSPLGKEFIIEYNNLK